jgi:cell division topological specificity factor MinE
MNVFPKDFLQTSGTIARERARLAVASDRLSCNPDELCDLRREVTDVLSKYFDLENDFFKIRMEIVCETRQGVQDVKTIQIK